MISRLKVSCPDGDSHGGEEGVEGLLPQDLPCHWVLHHPGLELSQLKHLNEKQIKKKKYNGPRIKLTLKDALCLF